ncbi:MAG TPA: TIGR01777 family oxidoreductase [Thermoanaerobaculia bacterium]|nr:TIGR01777 family oxidoreductase [Thermoanaerobaculia bacterium]
MDHRGRILITGGSGLIGRALTPELTTRGYEVVILSRRPEKVRGLPAGARAVGWDATTAAGWSEELSGALGIIHLAGANLAHWPWTAERKRVIRESRVGSGQAVLAAIQRVRERPAFLLQSSGVGYYGDRGDEPMREEDGPGRGFLAELCVDWEASTAAVEDLGVRRVVLRSGVVLSTEGGALPPIARPFKLFVGGPLGTGRQYISWIHIADEVRAIRFLAEHSEARGPFNLAAPEPVTNREMSREIAAALRRPNLLRAPAFALHLTLGEMSQALLEGRRVLPAALLALGFEFRFPRLPQALADLYA